MNSWKTIMLSWSKPLESKSKNHYYEILDVSPGKPSVFYNREGYAIRENEAYTAQQKFARRVVRVKEED